MTKLPLGIALAVLLCARGRCGDVRLAIESPMTPPDWALLERELLQANARACREFFAKYFDERGYLLCVERWGGDDGPDDAIENCNDWPILHALGASDDILTMYKTAWEGHLRQYTEARTTEVPFARDGMYYKEFPVMFDWQHNGEGLGVFVQQGLSDPANRGLHRRARRFAGFYMDEDPGARWSISRIRARRWTSSSSSTSIACRISSGFSDVSSRKKPVSMRSVSSSAGAR